MMTRTPDSDQQHDDGASYNQVLLFRPPGHRPGSAAARREFLAALTRWSRAAEVELAMAQAANAAAAATAAANAEVADAARLIGAAR